MNVPRLRFKGFSGEWEEKALEQLALVERGKFSVRPRNDPRYFGGSIPFVQTGDVVFAGLYLTRFSQTLNEEGLKVSRLFPKNTVLITIAANIGDTTITKFNVACTDSVVAIQPYDKKANPVWLKLTLDTKKEELDSKATQNAQKNINLQILKPLLLNTPSFAEQTKIANFLTAVDEKITQLTQKGELLARYKKGVMQQIFSQQLRFKDDEGQEFPEWEVKMLSDVNIYISDGNYGAQYPKAEELKQSGVPFIRANNINGLSLSWADMKFIDHSLHKMLTSGHLETNDILVTTRGDIGMVAYVNNEFHGANINAQICLLRVIDKSKLNTRYLLQLLSSTYCQKQFKELQTGSALKQLPKKNLTQIEILYPVISEQTKIANFLTALDEKISHNQTQLNTLKQYKQGLLQQMFV